MYDIFQLCVNYDVVFLQETWLTVDELPLLRNLHPTFDGYGTTAMDNESKLLSEHPYGGVAIVWRKNLSSRCSVKQFDDCRRLDLEVVTNNELMLLINVYMPYQCHDNYDSYMYYLGKLSALVDEAPTAKVAILGDLNAHINTLFYNELCKLCHDTNLIMSDCLLLGESSGTYTYVSDAHNTTSWLDHCLTSHSVHNIINNICILDKSPASDHLPIAVNYTVKLHKTDNNNGHGVNNKIAVCNWSKASDRGIFAWLTYLQMS
jgi:exonuclease III